MSDEERQCKTGHDASGDDVIGNDALVWPEFVNAGDKDLKW